MAALDFVIVDQFISTLVDARALRTALELGLIDRLAAHRSGSTEALGRAVGADPHGFRLLLDLLAANHVVEERNGDLRLTRQFQAALRYRDLLEVKLDYIGFTLNDFADLFTMLVRNPGEFVGQSRLFALFDYRRCLEYSAENYSITRGWMRITSTLTRYESRACMNAHDFSLYRRALDIGGNSGEFLLQLCRRHPRLTGMVLDLPLTCEIGSEHVLPEPEHARIAFMPADMRRDPVPHGFDLITFKSMLHDWPQREAYSFVERAAQALEHGGTLLIFERAPVQIGSTTPPFAMVPALLFFRSYRPPAEYEALLRSLGLVDVQTTMVQIDSSFLIVTGRKP